MTARFFNTAGPVNSEDHYYLPPLERFDLDEILSLIDQKKYFVLHAPRQTGKTSCLLALMDYLNGTGRYRCAYVNVEPGQAAREDVRSAMRVILNETGSSARIFLKDEFPDRVWPDILEKAGAFGALGELLSQWSADAPAIPLILLVDEIDSLVGDTLISFLRQIRAGYTKRPAHFPQSIILCGVRDVRDYRIHSDLDKTIITGGSAFNIKAESLRLGNFNREDVESLYSIHTAETGQVFHPDTIDRVWAYTKGQPWLVNALGYEVCFKMKANRDRSRPITVDMIAEARENLILRRETHLDQLADKLREDRVRRVIEPILTGTAEPEKIMEDDIHYVVDLGFDPAQAQFHHFKRHLSGDHSPEC